jgi:hypothetical protein
MVLFELRFCWWLAYVLLRCRFLDVFCLTGFPSSTGMSIGRFKLDHRLKAGRPRWMLLLLYLEVPNVLFAGTFWTSENEHVMGARFSKLKRLDPSRNRTLVLSHPKNPFKSLDQSLLTFSTLSGRRRLPLHRGWSSSLSTGPTAFLLRSLSSSPYTIHSSLLHNTTNTKKRTRTKH